MNEFEKCIPFFMEILTANFIQFSSAIANFLFFQGRLNTRLCVLNFLILLKFSQFLSRLATREVTRTFSL